MKEERNIEFSIGANRVPASLFKSKVNTFLDLLEEVTYTITKGKKKVSWDISVESGSQVLKAYPKSKNDVSDTDRIFNTIDSGIETISKGNPRPDLLSDRALEDIMRLSKPYKKNDNVIDKFVIKVNDKPQSLDSQMINYIQDIIGTASQAFGSVEGKLEVVSQRRGYSFVITDIVTDKTVKCNFKTEEFLHKVIKSFGKRISVYGLIKYNKHGDIVSILVDDFRVLLGRDELPSFNDVLGIFKN